MSSASASSADSSAYLRDGWTGGRNPWAIALVVTMATFMELLDTSIANVALPHMAGNLSVTQDQSTWVLTSYLVSNAVVLPISGWLASRLGRKRFYLACVALFTISSLLCGLAPSLGTLVFFRILQGVGGGGLGPSEQAILADTFPLRKRGAAFAVYGMAVIMAPAIGPTLGGYITDHYSWRWVFFINVPIGVVSLFLSSHLVTDPPHLRERHSHSIGIDYIGLALISVGLGCLEVVLDKGQDEDWFHSSFIVAFSITAAACLTSFVAWEVRQEHPIVDVRMYRDRSFASANVLMLILGATLYGTTVILPAYCQMLMGYTAQRAGMALSPGGITVIFLLPLVGTLVSRVDARWLIGFGYTVMGLSLLHMASQLYPGVDFDTVVRLRVFWAAGTAFLFVPINTLAYAGVPPQKNNDVSGMVNLARNMGGDIGIALVTTVIARRSQVHQSTLVAHTTPFDQPLLARIQAVTAHLQRSGMSAPEAHRRAVAMLYQAVRSEALTLAYLDAIWLIGVSALCMLPLMFLLKRNALGAKAPAGR